LTEGMDPLMLAAVPVALKIVAAIVVFGPVIVFAFFLIRAALDDGQIQEERRRGTGR
jgi:hypothetical protein